MTTQEIRQGAIECMNGCQQEPKPMSYAETCDRAAGFVEELGLVGHVSVRVAHWRYASGRQSLEWEGMFMAESAGHPQFVKAPTADMMLQAFRLELLKLTAAPPVDLQAVGTPDLMQHAEGA